MLSKLGWEISQFRRTVARQQDILGAILFAGYQAFNCAVTAWHCADWAWAYADDDLKSRIADRFGFSLKSRDRQNLDAFYDAVCRESEELKICRHIANSSKHLKLDGKKTELGFRATIGYAQAPEPIFMLLVEKKGMPFSADEIFDRAFRYWQRLYGELGYVEGLFVDGRD